MFAESRRTLRPTHGQVDEAGVLGGEVTYLCKNPTAYIFLGGVPEERG
jgi:hypothetical protein